MTIEQRVEKLERQNRWMRRIAVLVVVVAGAVLYVTKDKRLPILEVSAVQVSGSERDAELVRMIGVGKTRVLLTPSGITFYDGKGNIRASLGVYADGPRLTFQDPGKAKAKLTTRNLIFSNAKGDVKQAPR